MCMKTLYNITSNTVFKKIIDICVEDTNIENRKRRVLRKLNILKIEILILNNTIFEINNFVR